MMTYRRMGTVVAGHVTAAIFLAASVLTTLVVVISGEVGFAYFAILAPWLLIVWTAWAATIRPRVVILDDSVEVVQFCTTERFPLSAVRRAAVHPSGHLEIVLEGDRVVLPFAFSGSVLARLSGDKRARLLCKRLRAARKHHRRRNESEAVKYESRTERGPIAVVVFLLTTFFQLRARSRNQLMRGWTGVRGRHDRGGSGPGTLWNPLRSLRRRGGSRGVLILVVGSLLVSLTGCVNGDEASDDEPLPEPSYVVGMTSVPYSLYGPDDDVLLAVDELPWKDLKPRDTHRRVHDFCGGSVPSDAIDRFHTHGSALGSPDDDSFISIVQFLEGYEYEVGAIAVDEIRAATLQCSEYRLRGVGWNNTVEYSYSSCGELQLDFGYAGARLFAYCEVGHGEKGDYYTVHAYIGVGAWLASMKIAMRDRDEAERYTRDLLPGVAENLFTALEGE